MTDAPEQKPSSSEKVDIPSEQSNSQNDDQIHTESQIPDSSQKDNDQAKEPQQKNLTKKDERKQEENKKREKRRDLKEGDHDQAAENEIRVAAKGQIKGYLGYAFRILNKSDHRDLTIKATGNAIVKALILIELVKRRIGGLHQLNKIHSRELESKEPNKLEEGEFIITKRRVTAMDTILSKDPPEDMNQPGYQVPEEKDQKVYNKNKQNQKQKDKRGKSQLKKDDENDGKQSQKDNNHNKNTKQHQEERKQGENQNGAFKGGSGKGRKQQINLNKIIDEERQKENLNRRDERRIPNKLREPTNVRNRNQEQQQRMNFNRNEKDDFDIDRRDRRTNRRDEDFFRGNLFDQDRFYSQKNINLDKEVFNQQEQEYRRGRAGYQNLRNQNQDENQRGLQRGQNMGPRFQNQRGRRILHDDQYFDEDGQLRQRRNLRAIIENQKRRENYKNYDQENRNKDQRRQNNQQETRDEQDDQRRQRYMDRDDEEREQHMRGGIRGGFRGVMRGVRGVVRGGRGMRGVRGGPDFRMGPTPQEREGLRQQRNEEGQQHHQHTINERKRGGGPDGQRGGNHN